MIEFVKAHACGNDFLILEESAAQRRHVQLAKHLCARTTSIGADGIEFLDRRADGSFFLRLFNSDGSEAELSGNGTRCVAAWLAHSEGLQEVSLGTHGGVRTCRVLSSEGATYQIESGMGVPRLMPRTVVIDGIGNIAGAMVNLGNPHFVLVVDTEDFSAHGMAWEQLGERISSSPVFPYGTNVEFLRVKSPEEIEFRIYERGCGPTSSSGTGTCAASTAAIALHGAATELTAVAPGGAQRVVWPGPSEPMMLTGPAEIVCKGEALL
jgi:diaminopimelate epimerase